MKTISIAILLSCTLATPIMAQSPVASPPEAIDIGAKAMSVGEVSAQVKAAELISGLKKIVIQGEYSLNTWWLAASELEFEPGSSLVVSPDIAKQSHEIFIITKKTIDDPAQPPSIAWTSVVSAPPADRGQVLACGKSDCRL